MIPLFACPAFTAAAAAADDDDDDDVATLAMRWFECGIEFVVGCSLNLCGVDWCGGYGCDDDCVEQFAKSCLSGFSSFASYLRGRPRDKCLRFTNSLSSTIQNEPKSSSYLTKHLCSDKFVRIAFYFVTCIEFLFYFYYIGRYIYRFIV